MCSLDKAGQCCYSQALDMERWIHLLVTKLVSAATVRHSTGRKMDTSSCDKGVQCCDSQALDKTIKHCLSFSLHPVKCENTGGTALGRKYDILASFIGSLLKLET